MHKHFNLFYYFSILEIFLLLKIKLIKCNKNNSYWLNIYIIYNF